MAPRKQQKKPAPAPAPSGPDLYADLGLARDASVDDVKRAYRRLALQCHPDKCPGDDAAHEKFQRISMAYSVLSDPQKRRYYDQTGTTDGLDISPDEFMDMFQSLLLEIIGGADMIRDMLSCFTPRELARLPPFPFPKELFPPGTFPPGLRFSSKGLKGLPPQVDELIQGGDLHAIFAAMSGLGMSPPGSGGDRSRRAAGGRSGSGSGGGRPAGRSRNHAARPPPARDPFGYGRRGAAHAAASLFGGLFGGPEFGPEFGGEEFGDSDDDSDGSGGSSESEWTDVSNGELEAMLGQDHAADVQGEPLADSCCRSNSQAPRGSSTGGASGSGSNSDTASEKLQHSPQQSGPSPSLPPPLKQQRSQQSQDLQDPQAPPQPLLVRDWMLAARSCDVGALERLLDQEPRLLGCRGTGMGHTALHWCAAKGSVEGVAWLLAQGMDVNVRNDDGATPLHAAARNGRLEAVEVLLSWRPAASGSEAHGTPSLHSGSAAAAAEAATAATSACGDADVGGSAVCDLAAVDGEGRTALQLALEFQQVQVATLLLRAERGSDRQAGQVGAPAPGAAPAPAGNVDVAALLAEVTGAPEAPAAAATAAAAAPAASPAGSGGGESAASCNDPTALSAAAEAAGAKELFAAVGTAAEAAAWSVGDAPAFEATPWRPAGPNTVEETRPPPSAERENSGGGFLGAEEGAGSDSTADRSGSSCDTAAATAAAAAPQGAAASGGVVSGQLEPGTCRGGSAGDAAGCVDDLSASGASDHVHDVADRGSSGPGGDRSTGDINCRTEDSVETGSRQPAPPSAPPPPPPPVGQQQQPAPPVNTAADTAAAAPTTATAAVCGAPGSCGGACAASPRRSTLTPEEKAARRAALLAADAAAEWEEARREAEKAAQAEAAAAAAGLRSREEGKAWLAAARRGDLAALQRMLADNPRLLGYQGQGTNFAFTLHTALHWAVAKGHAAAARWLLQQGADPDLPNAAGATPLHAAASQKADDCARLLALEAAAKMGVPDSLGETVRDILLRRDTDDSGGGGSGGGGSGARLASELELLARVAALRDAPGGSAEWAPRAMRSLLAAAGINIAGLLERRELVDACKELVGRYPPRITVNPAARAAAVAAAENSPTAQRSAEPAAAAAAAAASSSTPAAAQQPRRTAAEEGSSGAAGAYQASPAAASPSQASPGGDGGGDGAAPSDAGAAAAAAAAASDAAKQRGNEAFSRGDFSKAVSHYTMALRLRTEPNAVLYSNRAAAYCGMSYFGKAQADAEEAIRLEPQQPKYRCRLGVALLGQLQFREADAAFRAALQIDPSYAAAVQGLEDVRAAVARRSP
ncbi:hypothetical protein PLESTB_000343900 [Pleodorina starrii]|uniref:J domain-containing protein n=1 Tax=Pleodorina starrii TaxID=330485 RepID=A0A9W6BDG2_9CHLO|nr:hypothetical protein PLESTM_000051000 [Pleodorina starrii]GLC50117.1 hypothetical protein PLESTB_000343900 [Pleodorina starrii]GLC73102.1 hypothetical protein PLESTF_001332400 [Pleodorina starrii]